jgi:hypothetical protein
MDLIEDLTQFGACYESCARWPAALLLRSGKGYAISTASLMICSPWVFLL